MASRLPALRTTVRKYYKKIDEGAVEAALGFFSNRIIYRRAGKVMRGIGTVRDFYLNERRLNGNHSIHSLKVNGREVRVTGVLDRGKANRIFFSDTFRFGRDGKIVHRSTKSAYIAKIERRP